MADDYQYVPGTCGSCGEPIQGDHIQAFQMQWHLDHLLCNACGKDFADGTQVCEGIDGFAYCPEHWQKTFCPQCGTCGKPIVGPTINAMNKSFHDACFICAQCKCKLDGKFYTSKTGTLMCEQHYFEETGRCCGYCGKPIIAGKIITMKEDGKYPTVLFHRDHFKCTQCGVALAGERYKRTKGKQYCMQCHLELFE